MYIFSVLYIYININFLTKLVCIFVVVVSRKINLIKRAG